MTSEAYPNSGPTYTYAFDTMGRINGMTDASHNTLVSGITYGPAGQLLTATYLGYNETRQYNVLNQLSRLTTTGTGGIDLQYSYSATQNNGKIMQTQDNITGEQISYTYDALLRLASATATDWGQSYTYDGFGSLTDQTLTQGSGPDVHVTVNPATNQLTSGGHTYDANGNDTSLGSYDNENHMVTAGSAKYGYAPDGKRVWKAPDTNAAHEEFYFLTPGGQRLGIYKSTNPGTNAFTTASTNVYFGGRLIQAQSTVMVTDQLGSNVGSGKRYYPYGAERPSATTNNIEKFTGYYRDTETGLDYADQRYHEPGMGRFTSPDPSASSAKLSDPGSWNRYAYVGGDPVNRADPSGQDYCDTSGNCEPDSYCQFAGNPDSPELMWCASAIYVENASVFQYDLGQGGGLAFSGTYDLNNGAPGFGQPPAPPANIACQQQFVQSVITADAAGIGGGLPIAGFPGAATVAYDGGPGQTELNLQAPSQEAFDTLTDFLNNSGVFSSWPSNVLVGPPHPGFDGNYRQMGLTNSMQVNTSSANLSVQIDIDPYNPAAGYGVGLLAHGLLQVLPNLITGGDTNYNSVANALGLGVAPCP